MKRLIFLCPLLFIIITSYAQNLKKELDSLINKRIFDRQLHGCVIYVEQNKKILNFKSYGFLSIERKESMKTDAIFRIASMSKLITVVGALKLIEDGKFLLDEPLKKYIPQFANLKVRQNIGKDSGVIVDLKHDITILDLCRITAGFESISTDLFATPDDFLDSLSKTPLRYQPGTKWVYGNGEIDVLGILIEKITHKNLNEYLTDALFKPLKMSSSGFFVPKDKIAKFSSFYNYDSSHTLKLVNDQKIVGNFLKMPNIRAGSSGMVSSASDLANFYNMLLNHGKFNNKQILKPTTIELLISDQIETINDRGFPVVGFGLGVAVNQYDKPANFTGKPDSANNTGKIKSIFWQGSYNTRFLIDFDKKLISIFLTQRNPWDRDVMKEVEKTIYRNIN